MSSQEIKVLQGQRRRNGPFRPPPPPPPPPPLSPHPTSRAQRSASFTDFLRLLSWLQKASGSPASPRSFQRLLQRIRCLSRLGLGLWRVSVSLALVALRVKGRNLSWRSSLRLADGWQFDPHGGLLPPPPPLPLSLALSFPDDPTKWLTCVTSPIDSDEPLTTAIPPPGSDCCQVSPFSSAAAVSFTQIFVLLFKQGCWCNKEGNNFQTKHLSASAQLEH